jgi:hypothetical protein
MYHAVKELGDTIGVGHPGEPSADFFRIEYEMNFMLANSPIPQVLLLFNMHLVRTSENVLSLRFPIGTAS